MCNGRGSASVCSSRHQIVGWSVSQPSLCVPMAVAPLRLPEQSVRVSRWSIDFGSIIGSGTFGSVYRARDEEGSGESAAAKVIYASRMRWAKILSEILTKILARFSQRLR